MFSPLLYFSIKQVNGNSQIFKFKQKRKDIYKPKNMVFYQLTTKLPIKLEVRSSSVKGINVEKKYNCV